MKGSFTPTFWKSTSTPSSRLGTGQLSPTPRSGLSSSSASVSSNLKPALSSGNSKSPQPNVTGGVSSGVQWLLEPEHMAPNMMPIREDLEKCSEKIQHLEDSFGGRLGSVESRLDQEILRLEERMAAHGKDTSSVAGLLHDTGVWRCEEAEFAELRRGLASVQNTVAKLAKAQSDEDARQVSMEAIRADVSVMQVQMRAEVSSLAAQTAAVEAAMTDLRQADRGREDNRSSSVAHVSAECFELSRRLAESEKWSTQFEVEVGKVQDAVQELVEAKFTVLEQRLAHAEDELRQAEKQLANVVHRVDMFGRSSGNRGDLATRVEVVENLFRAEEVRTAALCTRLEAAERSAAAAAMVAVEHVAANAEKKNDAERAVMEVLAKMPQLQAAEAWARRTDVPKPVPEVVNTASITSPLAGTSAFLRAPSANCINDLKLRAFDVDKRLDEVEKAVAAVSTPAKTPRDLSPVGTNLSNRRSDISVRQVEGASSSASSVARSGFSHDNLPQRKHPVSREATGSQASVLSGSPSALPENLQSTLEDLVKAVSNTLPPGKAAEIASSPQHVAQQHRLQQQSLTSRVPERAPPRSVGELSPERALHAPATARLSGCVSPIGGGSRPLSQTSKFPQRTNTGSMHLPSKVMSAQGTHPRSPGGAVRQFSRPPG